MKYRKIPLIVDAFRLHIDNKVPEWFLQKLKENEIILFEDGNCYINTLEGVMHSSKGDYIIKGVEGEIYPCKPDIFEKTYEKIDDDKV